MGKVMTLFLLQMCMLCAVVTAFRPYTALHGSYAAEPQTVSEILSFLEEASSNFALSESKDIVLVLGITGSGKSTLTLLITDAELEGRKVNDEDSDAEAEYIIFDKNNLIGNDDAVESKTLIPNLRFDANLTTFYDCAGFEDSRTVAHDIAVTYLIRKILNNVNSVKFLFTIPIWSVKRGGDKLDFKKLLDHATNLIVNVNRYKDSIALIATKADKPVDRTKAVDDTKIRQIATFINDVKTDLSKEDPHLNEMKIKFIDGLLKKTGDKYDRIRIHRLVAEKGPLENMPVQQDEKKAIKDMIYQNIQYQTVQSKDFGYSISSDSRIQIDGLLNELQQQLLSDVSAIGKEIKNFYWQQEKRHTNLNQLFDKIHDANSKLSKTFSDDLTSFRDDLSQTIDSLNMTKLLQSNMKQFETHVEFTDFLMAVSNKNLSDSFKISTGLSEMKQYLADSENWYDFLKIAHNGLSSYNSQDKIKKYDISSLVNKINLLIGELKENGEAPAEKIEIKKFIDEFELNTFSQFEKVKVNSFKLQMFVFLLNKLTMADEVSFIDGKLTVKGYNVKLSDYVVNMTGEVSSIEIFALNKVFIDSNLEKRGERKQIAIIAPSWEITSSGLKIDLSGISAENYPSAAKDGQLGIDGEAGIPGRPGGSSGHFFGIGKKFVNGHSLMIATNGGTGGAGQNGGKGAEGTNGDTPPYTGGDFTPHEVWKRGNFNYTSESIVDRVPGVATSYLTITYTAHGKEGRAPSNGGHGGCGGLGGIAGIINLIGLNEISDIAFSNDTGPAGADGKGAVGGATTSDGNDIEVKVKSASAQGYPVNVFSGKTGETPGKSHSSKNGADGGNCQNREIPSDQVSPRKPTEAVNSFKAFVRTNLKNNSYEMDLRQFLTELEKNDRIESFYDVVSYVDEVQSLEEQYFQLRKTLDFRPFFESLRGRIIEKEKTIDNKELKKALNYLYAAILGKLTSNLANQKTILTLDTYLGEMEKRLEALTITERNVQITNSRNEYHDLLYSKIDAANKLIKDKILPEIDVTLAQTKLQIPRLINETIDKQNQTEEAIKKQKEQEIALGKAMMLSGIFSLLKITSSALAFAGPIGAGIGGVLGAGTGIVESATGASSSLKDVLGQLTWSVTKIGEEMKYNNELFKQQLDDVTRELDSNEKFKNDFKEIRNKADDMREKIKAALATASYDQVMGATRMKNELNELMEKEKAIVTKLKPQNEKLAQDKLRILNHVQTTIKIVGMTADAFNQFKNDRDKMETIKNSVKSLETEFLGWKVYEQEIYSKMVPMFQLMQSSMKSTIQSLENQSHVELDIKKWEVKSKLRDVKFAFEQMTEKSKLQKDFKHHFEKVEAAMDILIDIYDRIESLVEHSQFASYIAQIASNGKPQVNDRKLENAIERLDAVIQTNIILEQHELVVKAFKQHYFPFAPLYFGKFELPMNWQLNDTDSLKRKAIEQIKDMRSGVIFSHTTIESKDKYLYSNVSFSHDGDAPPFYEWQSQELVNKTRELMQGKEIFLNLDIANSTDYAIKFNEFVIRLKLSNQTVQTEFNGIIEDYHISLKPVGNCFYRCGQRIYSMPTDNNVVLDYSMKFGSDGKPTNPNDVYSKISANGPFLSPYGLWSIQFVKTKNAKDLTKFENEMIAVEFVGKGQYLKNTPDVTDKICTNELDKYYTFESKVLTQF